MEPTIIIIYIISSLLIRHNIIDIVTSNQDVVDQQVLLDPRSKSWASICNIQFNIDMKKHIKLIYTHLINAHLVDAVVTN